MSALSQYVSKHALRVVVITPSRRERKEEVLSERFLRASRRKRRANDTVKVRKTFLSMLHTGQWVLFVLVVRTTAVLALESNLSGPFEWLVCGTVISQTFLAIIFLV